jgi:type I restriction enzyme, S subunit
MIPMKSHIMADDLSRYKKIQKTWFAYNPRRINIGSICQWMEDEAALVSPDYVVFRCKDDRIDHWFFNAFRQSHQWRSFMEAAGNGSVRVRIYFDDLARLKILLPPFDEQWRIADVIQLAEREIDLLGSLLEAYRKQKKGLMQKLLTGQIRVPVWEIGKFRILSKVYSKRNKEMGFIHPPLYPPPSREGK